MSERQSDSSSDESQRDISTVDEDSLSDEDYGVVDMHPDGNEPYQDEPLAIPGQEYVLNFEEDKDGIPAATLEARFTKICPVSEWSSCNFCRDELLVGALEYRCCREVLCAIGKAIFDGSIDQISCITQHEDYNSMINTAVLTMVGPLLRSSDGRYYKRKSGQNQNEYLRAVAYRWLVRWFCGYLGWDNRRPLPACIYHHIRKKFPSGNTKGFFSEEHTEGQIIPKSIPNWKLHASRFCYITSTEAPGEDLSYSLH